MKILLVIAVIAGGVWWFRQHSLIKTDPTSTQSVSTGLETKSLLEKTFTMDQVAEHKDRSSCYTVIRGMVYDVSAFIDKHPGGDMNILRSCGVDATAAFEAKHGGQEKPEATLAGFVIGTLAK